MKPSKPYDRIEEEGRKISQRKSEAYLLIKRSVAVDRQNHSGAGKTAANQMRKFQPEPRTQGSRVRHPGHKPGIVFSGGSVELLVDQILHHQERIQCSHPLHSA